MRRMLDPKELEGLGGGGDSKTLYHHHVSVFYSENPLDYEFSFDYYSFDGTESKNVTQLKAAIAGKTYACSGFRINSGSINKIISLAITISESNNSLSAHYINFSTGRTENQEINNVFNVIDKSNPVA